MFGAVQMYGSFHQPDRAEWFLLLGVALSSLLAQAFMTQAYGLTNQVLVSFVMYLGVFLNILWGRLFFDEPILASSLCGGALIILSSLYLSVTHKNNLRFFILTRLSTNYFIRYSSMAAAAFLPAPMAEMTVAAPVTMSPPA